MRATHQQARLPAQRLPNCQSAEQRSVPVDHVMIGTPATAGALQAAAADDVCAGHVSDASTRP